MSRICWLAVGVLCALGAASCAEADPSTAGEDAPVTITVAAASSLTDAFTELGQHFSEAHPGTTVQFNFAASSTLARQIVEGAPASVFASADQLNMTRVDDAGLLAGEPTTFARNELTLVTKADLDPPISSIEDLGRAQVVALCAATAPCGVLADAALARAGVDVPESQISRAPNARATLRAVSDGDADAALVYATDAQVAGENVTTTPLAPEDQERTPYSVGVIAEQPAAAAADDFARFLQTAEAQAVLARNGFGAP